MNLFDYIGNLSMLARYVEGKDFLHDLSEVGVSAASSMIERSKRGNDPRPFVHGAVTLLELSISTNKKYLNGLYFFKRIGRGVGILKVKHKYIKSSAMLAACLAYLGELEMAEAQVKLTLSLIRDFRQPTPFGEAMATNIEMLTGLGQAQMLLSHSDWPSPSDIGKVKEFSEELLEFLGSAQ